MNHDIIKPYHANRNSIYSLTLNSKSRNEKWSLNPQLNCPNKEQLPKIQQFKNYYFVKRNNEEVEKYKNNYLQTDYISIRVPIHLKEKELSDKSKNEENKMKKMFRTPFLDLKNEFNVNKLSDSSWSPRKYDKSPRNKSSVNYNIISFQNSSFTSEKGNYLDKTFNTRKKALGEYNDLTKTFAINYEKNYQAALKKDPKRFLNYNGIFSYLYDASHRNGNLSMPLRKKKNEYMSKSKVEE